MLHLFLCSILFFPGNSLCLHLVPFFAKMANCILQRQAPKYKAKNFVYSAVWKRIRRECLINNIKEITVVFTVQHVYGDDVIYQCLVPAFLFNGYKSVA